MQFLDFEEYNFGEYNYYRKTVLLEKTVLAEKTLLAEVGECHPRVVAIKKAIFPVYLALYPNFSSGNCGGSPPLGSRMERSRGNGCPSHIACVLWSSTSLRPRGWTRIESCPRLSIENDNISFKYSCGVQIWRKQDRNQTCFKIARQDLFHDLVWICLQI